MPDRSPAEQSMNRYDACAWMRYARIGNQKARVAGSARSSYGNIVHKLTVLEMQVTPESIRAQESCGSASCPPRSIHFPGETELPLQHSACGAVP